MSSDIVPSISELLDEEWLPVRQLGGEFLCLDEGRGIVGTMGLKFTSAGDLVLITQVLPLEEGDMLATTLDTDDTEATRIICGPTISNFDRRVVSQQFSIFSDVGEFYTGLCHGMGYTPYDPVRIWNHVVQNALESFNPDSWNRGEGGDSSPVVYRRSVGDLLIEVTDRSYDESASNSTAVFVSHRDYQGLKFQAQLNGLQLRPAVGVVNKRPSAVTLEHTRRSCI